MKLHTTNKLFVDQRHDGAMPASWSGGDRFAQKAKFIATVAWSLVKNTGDPELPNCDLSFQETQIGITESIMSGSDPDPTPFSLKVAELISELPAEELKR